MNLSTFPIETNPQGNTMTRSRAIITSLLERKNMLEFIERYKWTGLPAELNADLIERILYFRGKGCLFKGTDDKYRFLPFTLKGGIDIYGRYEKITPTLFTGSESYDKLPYLSTLILPVAYGVEDINGKAVILNETSLAISQDIPVLSTTIKPIIEQLVDILVLVNIDLISSAKAFYIVASDPAQKKAIETEMANLDNRILNGNRAFVVTSATGLEELTGTQSKDSARYFQSYQSFDNLRKDIIGLPNGGTFMKQEHQTAQEGETNGNSASLVYNNGLRTRMEFCDIANAVFGLNISIEEQEQEEDEVVAPEGAQSKQKEGE